METHAKTTLVKLGDSTLRITKPAKDVRGRKVLNAFGEEIGHVNELFIDYEARKVCFLQIAVGGFLGLGELKYLVPVDAVTSFDERYVYIDQTRDCVVDAPSYNPDFTDDGHYPYLHGYYGYGPCWGAGNTYSSYPFLW